MLYPVMRILGEVAARGAVFWRPSVGDGRIQTEVCRNAARRRMAMGRESSIGRASEDTPASGDTAHFTGLLAGFPRRLVSFRCRKNTRIPSMNSSPPAPYRARIRGFSTVRLAGAGVGKWGDGSYPRRLFLE